MILEGRYTSASPLAIVLLVGNGFDFPLVVWAKLEQNNSLE